MAGVAKKQSPFGTEYLTPNSVDMRHMQAVGVADTVASVLGIYHIAVAGAATANTDVTVLEACRIVDAWCILKGAGTTLDTIQIKNAANAVTEALDIAAAADKDLDRFVTYDDAYTALAAGGTLRAAAVDGGSSDAPALDVYVMVIKV